MREILEVKKLIKSVKRGSAMAISEGGRGDEIEGNSERD